MESTYVSDRVATSQHNSELTRQRRIDAVLAVDRIRGRRLGHSPVRSVDQDALEDNRKVADTPGGCITVGRIGSNCSRFRSADASFVGGKLPVAHIVYRQIALSRTQVTHKHVGHLLFA